MAWNVFRILADVSHTLSKCILIWTIHANRSAEGVSLVSQLAYLVVFVARYLPATWFPHSASLWQLIWNTLLKIFYITSSAYIVVLMTRVFARTRERERAWKIGACISAASLCLAPFVMMMFESKRHWSFANFSWTFSIILESVCILPQLLLLRQTTVPTVIDSFYLVTLGSYRAFYLLNWILRAASEKRFDPVSIIFGLIQTALYVDFAWVYWTRQRVKLRGGAVVDSDDMRNGWLVKRVIGDRPNDAEEGDEVVPVFNHHQDATSDRPTGRTPNRWGPKGISVSADEGLHEIQDGLADPEAFEDGESDDGPSDATKPAAGEAAAASAEWRQDVTK